MAQESSPGVIYLEVDEDITSAIDKLTKDSADKIQVVTAKRSTLFQSVINLRLLKKSAADVKKELILITTDRVSINLASRIGVPVAHQIGEPPIPAAAAVSGVAAAGAAMAAGADDEIDGGTISEKDPEPVKPAPKPVSEPDVSPDKPVATGAAVGAASASAAKSGKAKVPNISTMQKRILWIGLGLVVVIGLIAANFYFASAKVTLFAKGSQLNSSFNFTADPQAKQSNISANLLAATQISSNKTLNASVQATGSKDNGTKASGTMTVSNCTTNAQPLVSGTRFVSPDGKVFRSTADVSVPAATYPIGVCIAGKKSVEVSSDANGDSYNLGPADYTIPALSNPAVTAKGGQMAGGTSKIAKVITQGDVDKAKQTALDADKPGSLKEIQDKAGNGQVVLDASLQQTVNSTNPNPDVNAEAASGSVAVQVTYTALAVKKSELSDLAKAEEQQQVGANKQIYDDGSGNLQLISSGPPDASGAQKFSAKATAFAGTKIDTTALAKQIKGKKYGEAVDIASSQPDIDKAEIVLTPGWATSMPSFPSHIHIEIKASSQ